MDSYLKGVFKKGLSTSSLDSADSDEKESEDMEPDDPMSSEEFQEFKAWLAADQPNETPRKPPRKEPALATVAPTGKSMKVAAEGLCQKCWKASAECTSDGSIAFWHARIHCACFIPCLFYMFPEANVRGFTRPSSCCGSNLRRERRFL